MPAQTFVPTKARGAALAREILTDIEAADALRKKYDAVRDEDDPQWVKALKKRNLWEQGTWGQVDLKLTPAHTTATVLSRKQLEKLDYVPGDEDHALVLDQPVTCGTAMCFAGHATYAVGDRFVFMEWDNPGLKKDDRIDVKRKITRSGPIQVDNVITKSGKIRSISDRAKKLLGIDEDEAMALFAGTNSLADLRVYVEMMELGLHLVEDREGYMESRGQRFNHTVIS